MIRRYPYDLHIHSCLSPCGDDDMTAWNIAGMASLNGLAIAALTDHNTCRNCPAFFKACENYGVVPVAGMELTTAEEIHLVCLFERLEDAMRFDTAVYELIPPVMNRESVFGAQIILDDDDNEVGRESKLLVNAACISLEVAVSLVKSYGGVCHPAHIDREANGIVGVLGVFPDEPEFSAFELNDPAKLGEYVSMFPKLSSMRLVVSSDAHDLCSINEPVNFFELPPSDTPEQTRRLLFEYLRGGADERAFTQHT